jgi:hypothetical protein
MTLRGTPHGRRRAGGAPPGLQQSRINTPIREAHNTSSEVESTRTDTSAGLPVMAALRHRRYPRPFATWPNVRDSFPDYLEVQRFNALPAHQQENAWRDRRRHAPCDMEVSPAWDLDALYLRAPEEESYARNLRSLRHTFTAMPNLMSMDLPCFSGPLIPFRWPIPQTPCPTDYRNFPPRGDLPSPDGVTPEGGAGSPHQ